MSQNLTQNQETAPRLPAGIGNAFAFQIFNTMSFAILLGAPMVLWFKQEGASATMLGVLAALGSLLNVLQVPGARFLNRVGYQKFVWRGWVSGTFFIIGMVIVALLPGSAASSARLGGMLVMLVGYEAARGISTCGLLPWMTHLVPEKVRGRFVSFDQLAAAVAQVVTMMATAWYLELVHWPSKYGYLFGGSLLLAVASLCYLRKIPDVPVPVEEQSCDRVSWKEILAIPACRKYVIYNLFLGPAFSAWGIFWIPLLRDLYGTSDGTILKMVALWNAVLMVSLFVFARMADRVGSRPLLAVALGFFVIYCSSWAGLAAGVVPYHWGTLAFIQLCVGLASSLYNMALMRLLMETVPKKGGSHIFAKLGVVNCLMNGTLPVLWGLALDSLMHWHQRWGSWEWNNYSALYAVLTLMMLAGQYFLRQIHEPGAMKTDAFLREYLVKSPGRLLSRWTR